MKRKGVEAKSIWIVVLFLIICMAAVLVTSVSFAGEAHLVDKLVEKGVLTRAEAEAILNESRQEAAKAKAETKEPKIPEWVQNTKLKGDMRLRYQYEDREGGEQRERGRYRLRLSVESKIVDTVKVGFGLATGSGDPRSTNQTFTNSFEKPTVRIDYAFAEWHPTEWFRLTGGKMQNPVWRPSDLLWDSDITPEGVAAQFPYRASKEFELFLNSAFFVLDERGSGGDPTMFALQPGLSWNIADTANLKLAASYYGFAGLKGLALDHTSGTNTLSGGKLQSDYDSYGASAQLSFKKIADMLPYLAVYGEYIKNPDPDEENNGYIAGVLIGHKKIGKLWDWQLGYSYRDLKKDAWLDIFPDSDFHGGDTGVKGHEALFNLGLAKNIWLGLDYYHTENSKGTKEKENLAQVDFNFKF